MQKGSYLKVTIDALKHLDSFIKKVQSNFPEDFSMSIETRVLFLKEKHYSYLLNLFDYYQDIEAAAYAFIDDEVRLKLKGILDKFTCEQLLKDISGKTAEFEVKLWNKNFVVSVKNWEPDLQKSEEDIRNSLYDFVEYSEVQPGILFQFVDE